MDEASIHASLLDMTLSDGTPMLRDNDITRIMIEPHWVAVVLGREDVSRTQLERIHQHLSEAFPGTEFELRAGSIVHRGGAGFGEGRHIVAVLGGKGGVGKSTIAVNLALTLSALGMSVGLLDADLNAPDIPHLLGFHPDRPQRGLGWRLTSSGITSPSRRLRPHEVYGLQVMSIGFAIPERFPPIISTRMLVSSLLRYFVFEVAWQVDILLIDAPPGTGEELQVIAGELPISGALFVTTPQDLAQMDAERTLSLLEQHEVPVIGWVENMASLTCPHCRHEIDLFATSPRLLDAGVRPLGRIPFDVQLSVPADQGRPLVLGDPRGPIAYEFARMGSQVRRWLARA
ncbi:MAG: P-loop NTPase [Dehalococcoidia bacterium]